MFLIRRVVGNSMSPKLRPGSVLVFSRYYKSLRPGSCVMFYHDNLYKIKRIKRIDGNGLEVFGDNQGNSTDSRHFGRIDKSQVVGKLIWPRV